MSRASECEPIVVGTSSYFFLLYPSFLQYIKIMCSVDVAFTGYIGNNIEREPPKGERESELTTTTTVHNYTIVSRLFHVHSHNTTTIPPPTEYKASKLCILSHSFTHFEYYIAILCPNKNNQK